MCGENILYSRHSFHRMGSPPRVRGKLYRMEKIKVNLRITPACAGKTCFVLFCGGVRKDHPRVCGENPLLSASVEHGEGSPPRVRGKHFGNGVFPWLILVLSLDLL